MKNINTEILMLIIFIIHFFVIYLDNKATSVLILESAKPNNKVKSWNKRERVGVFRGIGLFIPPILGFFLSYNLIDTIILSYFLCSLASMTLTLTQLNNLNKKIKHLDKLKFSFDFKNLLSIFVGAIGFCFLYHVHFITNIFGYYFNEHTLWIVQLTPILTAISTFYMIFIIDKKIASNLDNGQIEYKIILQLFLTRILGRLINLIFSIIILLQI